MPETDPIAELDRLHAAATQITGTEWKHEGTSVFSLVRDGWRKGAEVFRNLLWFGVNIDNNGNEAEREAVARYIASTHNSYPALRARLLAAEAESVPLGVIRGLDPENLCDYISGPHDAEALAQWLAARDARMRREGAAEAYEDIRKQAEDVKAMRGLTPKLLAIVANECVEKAAAIREEK